MLGKKCLQSIHGQICWGLEILGTRPADAKGQGPPCWCHITLSNGYIRPRGPTLKTVGREAKMTVLKRSSDKCTAQQDSTRARPHRAAAVTNLVKEDISHGIFRALEAGAVAGEVGNKGQKFARLTHTDPLTQYPTPENLFRRNDAQQGKSWMHKDMCSSSQVMNRTWTLEVETHLYYFLGQVTYILWASFPPSVRQRRQHLLPRVVVRLSETNCIKHLQSVFNHKH